MLVNNMRLLICLAFFLILSTISVDQIEAENLPQIVFESVRDNNCNVYTINADGSGLTRLTFSKEADRCPRWSPDGKKLLFLSGTGRHTEICLMNADGSGLINLTSNSFEESDPAWSPDGSRIAFISADTRQDKAVFVMNADGSNRQRVLGRLENAADLSWSPDGKKIAFRATWDTLLGQTSDICLVSTDGSNIVKMKVGGRYPQWSPDGGKLLFIKPEITVHPIENVATWSSVVCVTKTGEISRYQPLAEMGTPDNAYAQWSPSGDRIAFFGLKALYIYQEDKQRPYDFDRGGVESLSLSWTEPPKDPSALHVYDLYKPIPVRGTSFSWSPDGSQIVCSSELPFLKRRLNIIDIVSGSVRQLTDGSGIDMNPIWRPF